MKNQYVGDIGDYGKYSLLRFIALHGIRIGVNWYLTDNDASSDGKFTDYLKKEVERDFDPYVYDELKSIVEMHNRSQRTVQMIQDANLIPEALFYDNKIDSDGISPMKRAWNRRFWFERSKAVLKEADLIFADPDNGITYKKTPRHKGCEKYTLPEEIALYYYSGKDVVFYCHKGRRTSEAWEQMILQIKESICDAKLFMLTFHRGTQRSYIFVVHPEKASINDWNKNQIIRIPIAGLLSYEEKQTKSDKLSTIINRVVVQYRKEIQNNNHGIRRPNFDKLYGKIGINTNEFDSTFISNLDTFGTQRGAVAHTSVQVQKLINIQDVHQLVSDIINGIDDFETVIQNESGLSIP